MPPIFGGKSFVTSRWVMTGDDPTVGLAHLRLSLLLLLLLLLLLVGAADPLGDRATGERRSVADRRID